MKLVLISDTHEQHDAISVPDGDVLIHAGDFTYLGEAAAVKQFNHWLGRLPHKHKILICGNHELMFERDWASYAAMITNATLLNDSGVEINGLKFWGSPITPIFLYWAFMMDRSELAEHWKKIPADTDVLITHGPPIDILDKSHPARLGCGDGPLGARVQEIAPKLHVFGHIHGGYGVRLHGETQYVNASSVNEAYEPVNAPIVVEIQPESTAAKARGR
ncbi:MAG TPA: metallophosphatase domain-containing protein [Candidatus Angelobacter sp.]